MYSASFFIEELFVVIERLRVADGAAHELALHVFVGLQIENERARRAFLRPLVVELDRELPPASLMKWS